MLELLIEEVSDQDYAEYIENEIFRPLEMDGSSAEWDPDLPSLLVTGHHLDGRPVAQRRGPLPAHGELHPTVADLAAFAAAGMRWPGGEPPGRGVLSPEAVAELYTPVVETRGLFGLGSDAAGVDQFLEGPLHGRRGVLDGGEGAGLFFARGGGDLDRRHPCCRGIPPVVGARAPPRPIVWKTPALDPAPAMLAFHERYRSGSRSCWPGDGGSSCGSRCPGFCLVPPAISGQPSGSWSPSSC